MKGSEPGIGRFVFRVLGMVVLLLWPLEASQTSLLGQVSYLIEQRDGH